MKKFKRVTFTKLYGGGGGGGQTTTSVNIPPELMPYLVNANQNAQGAYTSGDLSKVAGTTDNQQIAFGAGGQAIATTGGRGLDVLDDQQERLSTMAMQPTKEQADAAKAEILYNAQKGVAGLNTQFGANGTLGSARQAVLQGAQNADTVGKIAQVDADYENKMFDNRLKAESALGQSVSGSSNLANTTASGLAALGAQERTVDQSQLDSTWQGLQRYASTVYGNPARQTTSQAAGGK
jgi:hypothetical protein